MPNETEAYIRALENDLTYARSALREFINPFGGFFAIIGLDYIDGGKAASVRDFLNKPMPAMPKSKEEV